MVVALLGCNDNSVNKRAEGDQSSKLKNANLPIYPNAQNIEEQSLNKDQVQTVTYSLEINYPAKEVLNFYEKEMQRLGYEPFSEEYYKYDDRTWSFYGDATIKGSPDVAQLKADWVDSKKTKRASLTLKYYWYNKSKKTVLNDNKDLKVSFSIMPYYILPPPVEVTDPPKSKSGQRRFSSKEE